MLAKGKEVSRIVVGVDKGIECLVLAFGALEEEKNQFVDSHEGGALPEGVRKASFLGRRPNSLKMTRTRVSLVALDCDKWKNVIVMAFPCSLSAFTSTLVCC